MLRHNASELVECNGKTNRYDISTSLHNCFMIPENTDSFMRESIEAFRREDGSKTLLKPYFARKAGRFDASEKVAVFKSDCQPSQVFISEIRTSPYLSENYLLDRQLITAVRSQILAIIYV
jgi:hypothetical protein